ncbi:uncharacterized protein LOC107674526 [Sinocyclocheilus anshuiensis]|uniref:uncharacterized protein LOC107674526 n=1 Tax=Sinocyclocheilus anshuiensis TaxID=1608454 RepID=UPI0007B81DB1|nr:PREDICTED: uncharacterized protein LOC107674526 [Sinocyclocheilus anshuiensis]
MSSKTFKYLRREGASSRYCCVPFCKMSSRFNSVISFHSFPLNKETRKKWLHNIRREDYKVSPNTRVCSRHFKGDDFIEPWTPTARRLLKKGAVPTLFMWSDSTSPPKRTGLWKKRRVSSPFKEDPVPKFFQHQEHDYCSSLVQDDEVASDQTEDLRKEVERLKRRVAELAVLQRFCLGRFAASDDDIRFYTRFATYNHLMAFWRLIEPVSHSMVRLTRSRAATTSEVGSSGSTSCQSLQPIDEFFLFMVHLSVGLTERDLAHRFNIHQSSVNRIITSWANFLYAILGSVRIWMSEETVKAHIPKEFQDYPDTHVVIDCIELRCQAPSSLLLQGEGSHCTYLGLIGMAPHGAVTFVSSVYPGSVSDKELLKQSGIVSLLKPEMAIMVNKGFFIDDCVPCKVYRPAYLLKKEQMPADEVRETQSIARLRVHIERLIGRVMQHKLLETVMPLSDTGTINQLYTVACLLINYQNGPLLKAWAND